MLPADCPDDNALNAFVERDLPLEARAVVAAHLDGCRECLEIVSALAARPRTTAGVSGAAVAAGATGATGATTGAPASGDASPVAEGTRIGRYTVLAMIGQGGMGNVYLARDPQLDRKIALKLLRRERVSARMATRMANEARLMARLVHPNIVTVFEAGDDEGQMYIAMELIEGETLARWLQRGSTSTDEILDIFVTAGRALAVSHAAGVVHRDFKPDNVLLGPGGRVAVGDFGIATIADSAEEDRLAGEARWLGTPAYMSPEQYLGEKVGPSSDQFSFAVALYEALHHEHPFAGKTFAQRRESVLAGQPRVLSAEARRRVPSALRTVLEKAMARDSAGRYPSMNALLDAIEARRPRARGRGLRAGAVGALVLLITGAVVAASLSRRAPVATAGGSGVTTAAATTATAPTPATASTASSNSASSPSSAARTAVFVLAMDNRTGDARLDGVVECSLVALLEVSRRLDAYVGSDLRSQARLIDPGATGDDDAFLRDIQVREKRRVVSTRGELTFDGGTVTIALVARDVASAQVVAELHQIVPSRDDVTSAVGELSLQLRAALGDPRPADEGPLPRLSASLPALHDWAAGRALLATANPEAALVPLARAIAEDPAFAEAHATMGLAEFNDQDEPASAVQYDLALRDETAFGKRRRLQLFALSYAAEDRPSESIAASEELLAAWPGDLASELIITATAQRGREFSLALEFARRAIADHPEAATAHLNLAGTLLAHGDLAASAAEGEAFLAAAQNPPPNVFALVAVASALLGDRERALATYTRLAALDPEYADEGRADLAMYDGRFADAEALLRPLIARAVAAGQPSDARTEYRSLARCRLHLGDRAGARAAARAGLGRTSVVLQYAIASTLVESGSDGEATKLYKAWDDSRSVLWRAYGKVLAGDILLHHGKAAEAAQTYAAGLSLHDEWRMHERLGQAYLAMGDLPRARAELQLCRDRRGEGAVLETPSLQYVSEAEADLARVDARLAAQDAGR